MAPVRGIGFDVDHTLAIDNSLERVAFLHLLESVLRDGGRTIGTLADEIVAIDRLLKAQRGGELTIDDAVRSFVSAHACEAQERYVESFRATAVAMVDEFVVPLPGVRRTLDELRERGIAVAVLSNGWNPLQLRKVQRTGFSGPVLVSGEIGERKPSLAAFAMLLQALDVPAKEAWYVGDDPRGDVAGAHAAGMQTVWIDWEGKKYPADLPLPGSTIGAFDELLELLPAPVRAP